MSGTLRSAGIPDPPEPIAPLTSSVAAAGLPITAMDRLKLMSPSDWEDFVLEWAHSLKGQYARVDRAAGAGDQGIDVMAFVSEAETDPWDNYQCKHLDQSLAPHHVLPEIGKVAYHIFVGHYSIPRRYHFVAPRGAGNKLSRLLRNPDELKASVLEHWDSSCRAAIQATPVELTPELRAHIESLDFSIFSAVPPLRLLEQHAATRWHIARFGGGLPPRPEALKPPAEVTAREATYVRALLDAYEDRLGIAIAGSSDVRDAGSASHLMRSRREFYSAESLREFSRDNVPAGSYEALVDEVYDGVIDVLEMDHADALARVLRVVAQAKALALTSNALMTVTHAVDRGGMCHQLANDQRLTWRR